MTNINIPKEVLPYTTGLFNGSTNGKYSGTFDYPKLSTWGTASDVNHVGQWFTNGVANNMVWHLKFNLPKVPLRACLKSSGGRPACRSGRHFAVRENHCGFVRDRILRALTEGCRPFRRAGSHGATSAKMADATFSDRLLSGKVVLNTDWAGAYSAASRMYVNDPNMLNTVFQATAFQRLMLRLPDKKRRGKTPPLNRFKSNYPANGWLISFPASARPARARCRGC